MISFLKYKKFYFLLSLLVIVPGMISLALGDLHLGIDFTGGSLYEVSLGGGTVNYDEVLGQLLPTVPALSGISLQSVQSSGPSQVILRLSPMTDEQRVALRDGLKNQFEEVEEIRFETVGPTIGKELIQKTLVSLALASVAIVLFLAYSFKSVSYGLAAVLAMFHDTLVLLGVFSLLSRFFAIEVDTLFVAALLTVLSFSVHDTVVVFDRIRERIKTESTKSLTEIADLAVGDTMVRSLNNSLTIVFMLLALVLLGGASIRYFALALLVGTISGTYSSPFTAVPILHSILMRRK